MSKPLRKYRGYAIRPGNYFPWEGYLASGKLFATANTQRELKAEVDSFIDRFERQGLKPPL